MRARSKTKTTKRLRLISTESFLVEHPVLVDYWLVESEEHGFLVTDLGSSPPSLDFLYRRLKPIRPRGNLLESVYHLLANARSRFDQAVLLLHDPVIAFWVSGILSVTRKAFDHLVYTLTEDGPKVVYDNCEEFLKLRPIRLVSGLKLTSDFVREVFLGKNTTPSTHG